MRKVTSFFSTLTAVVFLLTAGQCVLFPDPHRLYYSTIGNNNWYAGFLSVSLPAGVALLLAKQKRSKAERALLVLYLMLALVSCVLVKSMSVILFLVPLAVLAVLFRFSVSGNEALAANARRLFTLAVYAIVPVCVLTLLLQLVYPFSDLFGSGRGVIWNAARQLLQTFSVRQWLFGTGQDLFYQATCADAAIHAQLESVFPGFRVTNAHAELLHMLVTQGLAGVCTYLALLFYTLKRALKELYVENRTVALCCILVIASYLATGTVTFRHVLSAPFVYMLAGVCWGSDASAFTGSSR